MQRLDQATVDAALTRLIGWRRRGDTIEKTVALPTFMAAIAFVAAVADVAERFDHHPDILVQHRRVTLTLTTHDAGGLTDVDLDTADAIDALATTN